MSRYAVNRFYKRKKDERPQGRVKYKKIKDEVLYELIKAEINRYFTEEVYNSCDWMPIRAEWYANQFRVPIHRVTQVFMRLNHEGLISRKVNKFLGDVWRGDPIWNASLYYLRLNQYPKDRKGAYPLGFWSKMSC